MSNQRQRVTRDYSITTLRHVCFYRYFRIIVVSSLNWRSRLNLRVSSRSSRQCIGGISSALIWLYYLLLAQFAALMWLITWADPGFTGGGWRARSTPIKEVWVGEVQGQSW